MDSILSSNWSTSAASHSQFLLSAAAVPLQGRHGVLDLGQSGDDDLCIAQHVRENASERGPGLVTAVLAEGPQLLGAVQYARLQGDDALVPRNLQQTKR